MTATAKTTDMVTEPCWSIGNVYCHSKVAIEFRSIATHMCRV